MITTGYEAPISVSCIRCGMVDTHDYWVTDACDKTARLSYARTFLRTLGWVCDGRGDFCPVHTPGGVM